MFSFIEILPVEDTYFLRETVPENVRLTYQLVKLNYMEKSPFKNGDLVYMQKDNHVYIWFIKYSLPEENKIYIPESYLLVKNYQINTGFLIIEKENSFNILVVKNKDLVSQVSYKKKPYEVEKVLKLLEKEYSLDSPEIKEIKKPEYKYTLKDIILFSNLSFNREEILRLILKNISIPISVFLFSIVIYKVVNYHYLKVEKERLAKELISLKKENLPIKEKIRLLQEKSKFWNSFYERELKYPFVIDVIYHLAKVINSYEGFITNIIYTPQLVSVTLGVPKKRKGFIEKLMETNLFSDIKILTTAPDRLSKDYEVLEIEFYVKPRGQNEK